MNVVNSRRCSKSGHQSIVFLYHFVRTSCVRTCIHSLLTFGLFVCRVIFTKVTDIASTYRVLRVFSWFSVFSFFATETASSASVLQLLAACSYPIPWYQKIGNQLETRRYCPSRPKAHFDWAGLSTTWVTWRQYEMRNIKRCFQSLQNAIELPPLRSR